MEILENNKSFLTIKKIHSINKIVYNNKFIFSNENSFIINNEDFTYYKDGFKYIEVNFGFKPIYEINLFKIKNIIESNSKKIFYLNKDINKEELTHFLIVINSIMFDKTMSKDMINDICYNTFNNPINIDELYSVKKFAIRDKDKLTHKQIMQLISPELNKLKKII